MNYQFKCIEIEVACSNLWDIRQNIIVPNISWGANLHECDLLIIRPNGNATEIEIKVSLSDLKNDFKKEHQHKSDKIKDFYYAIPDWMYDKAVELIPEHAGIILCSFIEYQHWDLIYKSYTTAKIKRKSISNKYAKPFSKDETFNIARLGTMRIWSLKRKLIKHTKKEKKEAVDNNYKFELK